MDRAGFDRLERLLSKDGEVVSAFLLLVPLAVEFWVRYGLKNGVLLWLLLGGVYGLLHYLRTRTSLSPQVSFALIIFNYFVSFAILAWLVSEPLSPLLFVSVIISTFITYVFPSRGVLWTICIFSLIIILAFWLQTYPDITPESFSQLLSTVSMLALLIIFASSLVSLNQGEIGELNETYTKLRAEHLRLVSLVNTLGDAVIATDVEGLIQVYNGAALELLDTNSSLTGKRLDSVWHLVDNDGHPVNLLEESRRVNTSFRRSDLIIKYGDNDQANLYINVTPLKVGYGKEAQHGFTFIMRDITKEKSLDEERDEFVSVVSHELRTPVAITEGKVSNALLLLEKSNNKGSKLQESLQGAHDQVVFLSNMINDLASLARAEREDADLKLEKVDPAELITSLAKNYEAQATQKNLSLDYHLPLKPLPSIYTSRLYLDEILQNFITNSIKYTKSGGVTLGATFVRGGVRFSVADTGIGISTSDVKRIFEKFFRSEDYRTRENSGTGLGLYVTHKLAKKINAKIEVESKIDEGSTFYLSVSSLPDKTQRSREA